MPPLVNILQRQEVFPFIKDHTLTGESEATQIWCVFGGNKHCVQDS